MYKFKVAICQYATAFGDKDKNATLSLEWLDKAGKAGAALSCLPELVTTGYAIGEKHYELAETIPGPLTAKWSAKASEYGMHIVAGLCEKKECGPRGVIYNSAVLINDKGETVGSYAKTHLPTGDLNYNFPIEEAGLFRRGDKPPPVFKTRLGRIGIMVCFDAVFPELFRVCSLNGAEIVVVLYNSPVGILVDLLPILNRAHAFFNNLYVIAANKVGVEYFERKGIKYEVEFHGGSHIADPMGNLVGRGKLCEEDLVLLDIDTSEVYKAQLLRKHHHFLRPELYKDITAPGFGTPNVLDCFLCS